MEPFETKNKAKTNPKPMKTNENKTHARFLNTLQGEAVLTHLAKILRGFLTFPGGIEMEQWINRLECF